MVRITAFIFLLFSTFSIIGFFLPVYLQGKGFDSGQIGSILAWGALASIFGQPFWGYVSDKRKTIKHVLQLLLISSLLLSIGLFSAGSFVLILIFFAAFSYFNSAAGPLAETLCISYARENNKDYGRIRLWGEVGVGISALLLGVIVGRVGLDSLWFIYAASLCIAIAATLLVRDTKATSAPVNLSALGKVLAKPKLLWFLLLVLLIAIPHRMNDSMLAIYLIQMEASETELGLAWLVGSLSTVPALFFVGKVLKKWNELGILLIAALIYTVRWAIYSQADSPTVLIVSQLFHSLTFPLFFVASIQYLLNIVPAELRATGQAAFAVTFGGLGGIIGSVAGGYAIDHFGPDTAYGAGSILSFIGAIAIAATYMANRRKSCVTILKTAGKQANI